MGPAEHARSSPPGALRRLLPDTGPALLASVCVLGLANGSASRISRSVAEHGWAGALFGTFDISAVVWLAFLAVPAMLLRLPARPPERRDWAAAAVATPLILLPVTPLAWVALSGLAAFLVLRPDTRPAGWVLGATAGAMFWGFWLLALLGRTALDADAALVGWLLGAERSGNTVGFADSERFVWIAPGCSSLTNLSLAVLCWVLVREYLGLLRGWPGVVRCLLACAAVVLVNVGRIALMLVVPESFDLIHGATGAAVAGWVTLLAVAALCLLGSGPARVARV